MKKLLLTCLLALAALPALAENPYSIDLMGTGKEYLFHDGGWKPTVECIEAKVSSDVLLKKENMLIKAYFLNEAGTIMEALPRPSPVAVPGGGSITEPMEIAKGKKHEFFFGIPTKISQGSGKWRRVIVVFGDKTQVTARVYPKDDITKFDFPEKALMKQQ